MTNLRQSVLTLIMIGNREDFINELNKLMEDFPRKFTDSEEIAAAQACHGLLIARELSPRQRIRAVMILEAMGLRKKYSYAERILETWQKDLAAKDVTKRVNDAIRAINNKWQYQHLP